MTSRTASAAIRLGAAALLLAAALPLSACLNPFDLIRKNPEPHPTTSAPDPDAGTTTDEPSDTSTDSAAGSLYFEDPTLPAGTTAEWSDGLISDSDWDYTTPDDGKGNWGFTRKDGICTAKFWQGTMTWKGQSDDRAASDAVLAAVLGTTPDKVSAQATDDVLTNATSQTSDIASRTLTYSDSKGSGYAAARGFLDARIGFYVAVTCTDDSASSVAYDVLDEDTILIH
ncbi:hypothetical protein [Microbacterium sp. 22242]|uniref:hypothetical protein n=1 Tax=Microbacterium sp. 22242 TaxID=3453896 RepID=UPI003F850AAD